MKKFISLVFSFALVMCLSGCVDSSQQADSSGSSSPSTGSSTSSSKTSSTNTPSATSSKSSSSASTSKSSSASKKSSSSSKKETGRYYDEKTGDTLYTYSDGTEEYTDGWGNVVRGKSGKAEEYSTDGGMTWHKYK